MSKTVTASDVRVYFQKDAKRLSALSDQAAHTVQPGARGQVHPDAIKAFNAKRRKDSRYVRGASGIARTVAKSQAEAARKAAAEAGVTVGKRGPLSKAALAALKG